METPAILFVDDEANVLKALRRLFMDEEYEQYYASSGAEGLKILEENTMQVVVSDYRMPEMNGVDFLKAVNDRWPETIRIVLSGFADTGSMVAAINEGQIYRFIPKPWNDEELKLTIAKAFEVFGLRRKNIRLTEELQTSNEELKLLNENLEERVKERTEEVLFHNLLLQQAHNILGSLPVGVVGIDNTGLIVQANKMAVDNFRTCGKALSGCRVERVFPEKLTAFLNAITENRVYAEKVIICGREYLVRGHVVNGENDQKGKVLVLISVDDDNMV